MSDEVKFVLAEYVSKYNDFSKQNLENNLVRFLWESYIGQFSKVKKRLKALNNVCCVMIENCKKIDSPQHNSPQHKRLERALLRIKQNSDYDSIINNCLDLCSEYFFSYGTIMKSPSEAVKYITYLLYFTRTTKQIYRKPRPSDCWNNGTVYRMKLKIYHMFKEDIKYINEQQ